MAHDVFICHSSEDKTLANAACAKLEAAGIRCWIAPRDPLPGIPYGRQLVSAIETSGIILLIFSGNANRSEHILRELELASDRGKIVVPYRIEDVKPTGDLEYYIRNVHWLDAMSEPVEARLDELVALVRKVLETVPGHQLAAAAPVVPSTAEPVAAASAPSAPAAAKPAGGRTGILVGACGLVLALAAGAFAFVTMNGHKDAAVTPPPAKAAVAAPAAKPAAAQQIVKPALAAAAPVAPAAAPTARIVYVEKPAAAAVAAAPAVKPAVHAAEAAKPAPVAAHTTAAAPPPGAVALATAAPAAPPAGASSDFAADLHRLITAAANHFADVKGAPRKLRGEQQYAYTGGVAGLDNCFIHQNPAGVLAATTCRVYLGPDADAALVAYKKYSALLTTFAASSGGRTNERTRPDGGVVTSYNGGEARLRLVLSTNDKINGNTVFLWSDAPP